MPVTALHVIDLVLWAVLAVSVVYVLIFAVASVLPRRKGRRAADGSARARFLVLFPAYAEDRVILDSVETFLRQDYPTDSYTVAVISDHMQPATDERLSALPVRLLQPVFEKSSKARAMQYAVGQVQGDFSHVVILDADNHVQPDFLTRLNAVCQQGYGAVQCHRTAKNLDSDIAMLDGTSEAINNSIFRRGHNRLGLSSALIGSGMCFRYDWFCQNVHHLDSAVEDRELEALLLRQRVFIYFADDIPVMDEKVSSHENFQRQRLRWMNGQFQSLLRMLPYVPQALGKANFDYVDKTLQQALIPRSILLVVTALLAIAVTCASPRSSIKWWALLAALCLALLLAMPARLRTRAVFSKLLLLPRLVWRMLGNLTKIDKRNTDFLHTTHGDPTPDTPHGQRQP